MEKFRTVPNCHNKRLVILSMVMISGAYCTAINNAQQTDSASCKFFCFGGATVAVMMQVGYYNASARW